MDQQTLPPPARPTSPPTAAPARPVARPRSWLPKAALAAALLAAIGGAAFYFLRGEGHGPPPAGDGGEGVPGKGHDAEAGAPASTTTRVEITRPHKGGIERVVNQVASVQSFEYADLYAQVSGYLEMQDVDFGSVVKRGQVLAKIDIPTQVKRVEQMEAKLSQAKSTVDQSRALINTAKADYEAAQARIHQSQAEVARSVAHVNYREAALRRLADLAHRGSVEYKLVEEAQEQSAAAHAEDEAAKAAVITAKAAAEAARAKIAEAEADLKEAEASVLVAQADLDAANVVVAFGSIASPYDGVVTRRNFFRGSFIRAAQDGGELPLLTVARTDKMRVIVQLPDRYVPFAADGNKAVVSIDSLPGKEFPGVISRMADSEDHNSRLMHIEIDLANSDHYLHDGMYGNARIVVSPSSAGMTIPSTCLIDKGEGDRDWFAYVVRDGKAFRVPVEVGNDNGVEVEVVKGLTMDQDVVAAYNGALADGVPVIAVPYKASKTTAPKPPAAGH